MAAFTAGVPFKNKAILAVYPHARQALQAAFGADLSADDSTWTWTDLTTYVRQNDGNIVTITPMGRSDESGTAQPAGLAAVLDNTSGDLTAFHPASQYYPNVRRNTPIRFLVNLTGDTADTSTRFFGLANGWPMSWQDDGTARIPVISLTASGEVRKTKQGKRQFSPLRQYVTDTTSKDAPVAYWPMEEGSSALQATSTVAGVPPLTQTDGTLLPTFGGRASTSGTAPVVVFKSGSTLEVNGLNIVGPFVRIPFLLDIPTAPAAAQTIMRVFTNGTAAPSYSLIFDPAVTTQAIGQKVWLSFELNESGGNVSFTIAYSVWTVNPTTGVATPAAYIGSPTVTAGTLGTITGIKLSPFGELDDVAIGHLAVYRSSSNSAPPLPSVFGSAAFFGYAGENAATRLARLAAAQGVTLTVVGTSDTLMGPEPYGTFLDKVRDVEATDGGLLLDGLGQGYLYVTRNARYNQTAAVTISALAAQLAPPLAAQDNDQRNRNLIRAVRRLGGDATYEDVTGPLGTDAIGTYDDDLNVNVHIESELRQYAAWAVHLGTVEGYRYPTLTLDFTAKDAAALAAAWLAVLPSDLVKVTRPGEVFAKHPPGDIAVLVEGWSERISPFVWDATLNCSPAAPWQVGTIEGDERLDCGGSTLNGAHNSTTTSLSLNITDECVWAHDDGDYVIVVDGEEMTVTAVGAAAGSFPARTQTLTVTRSVNGIVKSHSSGASVHVRDPIVLAL